MATIYNSDLSKELQQGAKIQINRDDIPNQLAEKVVPVMEVNPKLLRRCNIIAGNTSTVTSGTVAVYTTPSDKDFYLVSYALAVAKDAACDISSGSVSMTATEADMGAIQLLGIPVITLTLQQDNISVQLPFPIKLKRNTAISIAGTFTAGICSRIGRIVGYTVED